MATLAKAKDNIVKYEHLNKVNLIGAIAIGVSLILTVAFSSWDFPHMAVYTASVLVAISTLLWAGCVIGIIMVQNHQKDD